MAVLNPREVRSKLVSKFDFESDGGTNHSTFVLTLDGKVRATVQVGRHTGDIGPKVYKFMANQAHVLANQFYKMIKCTISKQGYWDLLGYQPARAIAELDGEQAALPAPD